jgi:hypothetical protein
MSYFLAILGSPSKLSRNSFLLHGLQKRLEPHEKTPFRTSHAIELQPSAPGASDRLTDLIGPKNWVFSTSQPPWLTAGTELRLTRALDQLHALTAEPVAVS